MMSAGIASGLGSLTGGLYGMFGGGGANSVGLPPQQSVDIGGITSNLNSQIPQLGQYNLGGQNYGQYAQILQNTVNNPYGQQGVQTAQQFAPYGVQNAGQAMGNAQQLGGTVPGLIGAAGSILNTAFDPQNALFKQQQDLQSQQSLAGLSQSGLAQTPWGQGVYGQNMGNFDINWQNNLLNREVTGAQGAEGLLGQAGTQATGAFGLGQQAGAGAVNSALLPYSTQNTLNTNALSALSGGASYGSAATAVPQTGIGDWLSYLSGGNSANSVANQQGQLALNQNQQAFNQNQIYGSQIGGGLAGLGNYAQGGGYGQPQMGWGSYGGTGGGLGGFY